MSSRHKANEIRALRTRASELDTKVGINCVFRDASAVKGEPGR